MYKLKAVLSTVLMRIYKIFKNKKNVIFKVTQRVVKLTNKQG